jgi:MFS family permease
VPFYFLIFFSALLHSVFSAARVTVSLYAIHLQASPLEIGAVMALFGLLPMIFSVGTGRLVDSVGPRTPMLAGAVMVSLGGLIPFVFPSLQMLYAASALVGTGFMFYGISLQNIVGLIGRPEDRNSKFSVLALSFSASSFVGPLASGLAIDAFGHRYWFLVLAVVPLATIAAVASNRLGLPQVRPRSRGGAPKRLADLLRPRNMRVVFIITALHATAWEMFQFITPIYCTQIGLSASAIGMVIASFAAATFAIRVVLAFVAQKISAFVLLRAAVFLAATTFALFPLVVNVVLLAAIAFALGVGLGSGQPLVMALLHDTMPEGRTGEAVGLRTTIINTGQVAMPIFFGALGTAFGVAPVYWAVAVILAAGGKFAFGHRAS